MAGRLPSWPIDFFKMAATLNLLPVNFYHIRQPILGVVFFDHFICKKVPVHDINLHRVIFSRKSSQDEFGETVRGVNCRYIVLPCGRSLPVAVVSRGVGANRDPDRRPGPFDRGCEAPRKLEIVGLSVVQAY
jgi:hypothetical protein